MKWHFAYEMSDSTATNEVGTLLDRHVQKQFYPEKNWQELSHTKLSIAMLHISVEQRVALRAPVKRAKRELRF